MQSRVKRLLVAFGAALIVFTVLDFGYLLANARFFFIKPQPQLASVLIPEAAGQPEKMQPDTLVIDSLGIKVPIQYATSTTEQAWQAALINGVVHYPGTADPGSLGNCYIFGHSSDFIWSHGHYKTVFAVLPNIKKGAEIDISDHSGNRFVYLVTDGFVVAANDSSVLDQQNYQKKLLTLQTSWPVGTALKRYIVRAETKN